VYYQLQETATHIKSSFTKFHIYQYAVMP